jgi:hypothetical protein
MGFTSRPVVVACGELSALAVGGSSYFPSFRILRHQPRAGVQNGHLAVRTYLRPRIDSSNVLPDGIKPSRLKHAFSLVSASWHTPAWACSSLTRLRRSSASSLASKTGRSCERHCRRSGRSTERTDEMRHRYHALQPTEALRFHVLAESLAIQCRKHAVPSSHDTDAYNYQQLESKSVTTGLEASQREDVLSLCTCIEIILSKKPVHASGVQTRTDGERIPDIGSLCRRAGRCLRYSIPWI